MYKADRDIMSQHCPTLPWCQDEPEKIASAVIHLMHDQENFIKHWSYKWYENMQFVYGNHHLRWSRRLGVAVDVDFLRPAQRAVNKRHYTNISRTCAESLGSLIYSNTPTWEAKATDDAVTRSSRWEKMSQSILDAYVHILELHNDFRQAANTFVTFGQIAAVVDFDVNVGKLLNIQKYVKRDTPVMRGSIRTDPLLGGVLGSISQGIGSDGQPMVSNSWVPESDEQGRKVTIPMHVGRPRVTFITPFEYRREPGSSGMHTAKWVQRLRLIDFDDWIGEYGKLSGKTAYYDRVIPQSGNAQIQQFAILQFLRLHMISPITDDGWRQAGYNFSDILRRKILVVEHWDRPNQYWPKGRRVVVANGYCTHITEPQYSTNKVGGWHPFVEASWFSILPSSVATGPLHDVVAKNKQLNTCDSLVATALLRNLGSQLLVRSGSGLDPAKISGTPGEIHEVGDVNTAARWLHDDNPIPPVIQGIREEYKSDTYEMSASGDAVRGARTVGVSSGYAYRQAQEREERRLTPARKEWQRMIGGIGEKLLACVKANVIQLDDAVIGYMKKHSAGKFTTQDVAAFISEPLDYGVDITVEDGSMEMKSRATQQANFMELTAKTPLKTRLEQDAAVFDKFLKMFDADHLRDGSAAHRDRADRENEIFSDLLSMGPDGKVEPAPIVWAQDDHDIHMQSHADWMIKNDQELSAAPWLMSMLNLHIEMHRVQKRELQGQVPVGTTDVFPQISAATSGSTPNLFGVIAESRQKTQREVSNATQQQPQQPRPSGPAQGPQERKAPPAPSQPAPPGSGGPPQTPVGAASQNTPAGRGQV